MPYKPGGMISELDRPMRDPTWRNVVLLAVCQALVMSCLSLALTVSALVGSSLAPDPGLGTFPLALQFVGTMATTIPASMLMERIGRRAAFSIGALVGALGGALGAQAIFTGSFWLFAVASLLLGVMTGFAVYFRFAATDTASDAFKARAISYVLAGGLIAAIAGPQIAIWSRELFAPVLFAGGYVAIAVLTLAMLAVLQFIRIPRPSETTVQSPGRSLVEIVRQPAFVVAAAAGMVSYGAMNLIMVSTPLAMVACSHPFDDAAFVIQWHVVGMYGPSFFTGNLVKRFGVTPILGLGAVLILACVGVNLSGIAVIQFWTALVLLGLGWNFLFVGGSILLTETYRPAEKAKVQATNDFLVFGTTAVTALSSGALFHRFGWEALNLTIVLPVVAVLAAALWLNRRRLMSAV